jgi:radial spoke head protein 9
METAEHLKHINLNGVTMSIDELLHFNLSIEQLRSEFKLDHAFFWGKVIGTVKDYFVVMALDYNSLKNGFPSKRFFWCSSSNFIFASLPQPLLHQSSKFDAMNTYFTGEYDRVLVQLGGAPTVIDADAGIVIPPKNITELDRLSYVVHTIEEQC